MTTLQQLNNKIMKKFDFRRQLKKMDLNRLLTLREYHINQMLKFIGINDSAYNKHIKYVGYIDDAIRLHKEQTYNN